MEVRNASSLLYYDVMKRGEAGSSHYVEAFAGRMENWRSAVQTWEARWKKTNPGWEQAAAEEARIDKMCEENDARWKADDPEGYAEALAKEESERAARAKRLEEDLG